VADVRYALVEIRKGKTTVQVCTVDASHHTNRTDVNVLSRNTAKHATMTSKTSSSSFALAYMHTVAISEASKVTVNEDLLQERSKATFSVERLTNLLDGGKERTERRRQIEEIISRDPSGIFSNDDNHYLHRTERHKRALAKHVRMVEICRKLGIGDECDGQICQSKDFLLMIKAIADDLPTSLHWVMFLPNIVSLCDDEQQAEWLPLCRDWKMIGCYAQTEIGHGSNVRALETTATFFPEHLGGKPGGSWIINSPTLTSSKAWPGTLGRTANHAMVIARLIDGDGVDRGMHNFLVPLRSMQDHKLLPGVVTGDLGPKIGYNNMDNGFARFDKVIVPRRNMAMRFATVDKNGKYSKRLVSDATSKIAYITMMQVRAYIVGKEDLCNSVCIQT
jgi:acyl-CoA oxidase